MDWQQKGHIQVLHNFLTETHANDLFRTLNGLEQFEPRKHRSRGVLWFGDFDYNYSSTKLQPYSSLKNYAPLHNLSKRLTRGLHCHFNSCLINYYANEHDHCGFHSDDETIFGFDPTIASISLGFTRRFQMIPMNTRFCKTKFTIPLNHGDLLVMAGDVQTHWKHAILKEDFACTMRINLTFRFCLKL
jgi:alkylated DNA repair dioxygenase AlkB